MILRCVEFTSWSITANYALNASSVELSICKTNCGSNTKHVFIIHLSCAFWIIYSWIFDLLSWVLCVSWHCYWDLHLKYSLVCCLNGLWVKNSCIPLASWSVSNLYSIECFFACCKLSTWETLSVPTTTSFGYCDTCLLILEYKRWWGIL